MRGIDALMRIYRRLEKLEMYVQLHTVQYCICRHRIMCTRSYGRPACHRYQLILLDLPKNLPIKVRWARQAGRFVVGRILADSQVGTCDSYALVSCSDAIPSALSCRSPCAKKAVLLTSLDESESVGHGGGGGTDTRLTQYR